MLIRIAYAWLHATSYFARRHERLSVLKVLPKMSILIAAVTSGSVLRVLERTGRWKDGWLAWLQLLGLGVILGLGVLGILYVTTRFFADRSQNASYEIADMNSQVESRAD